MIFYYIINIQLFGILVVKMVNRLIAYIFANIKVVFLLRISISLLLFDKPLHCCCASSPYRYRYHIVSYRSEHPFCLTFNLT
jgi:hypothetical protein